MSDGSLPAKPDGTLSVDDSTPTLGQRVTFDYSTTKHQVDDLNWIGLYSDPGNGPVHQRYVGPSTKWKRAAELSGHVGFDTSSLGTGRHIAFYLFDDGYRWLAEPVTFDVRPAERYRPPQFIDAFGLPGGGSQRRAMLLPSGVSVGPRDLIWVADTGNDRVLAWAPDGTPFQVVGEGTLSAPMDVAVAADGSIFVADTGNDRIAHFDEDGNLLGSIGAGDVIGPRGVAVDADGHVFASDSGTWRVREYDAGDGSLVQTFKDKMSAPQGVVLDPTGNVWVTQNSGYDAWQSPIVSYAPDGSELSSVGNAVSNTFGGLSNPAYLALDGAGHVLVTSDYGWVSVFDMTGPFLGTFGAGVHPTMRFPAGIAVDGAEIYVADAWTNQLLHYRAAS